MLLTIIISSWFLLSYSIDDDDNSVDIAGSDRTVVILFMFCGLCVGIQLLNELYP